MAQQTSLREQIIQELEQTPDSRLPEILAFCRSLKQPPQSLEIPSTDISSENSLLRLLKRVKTIQAQVPPQEWGKVPHDGSINHDHYLYDSPKEEE